MLFLKQPPAIVLVQGDGRNQVRIEIPKATTEAMRKAITGPQRMEQMRRRLAMLQMQ